MEPCRPNNRWVLSSSARFCLPPSRSLLDLEVYYNTFGPTASSSSTVLIAFHARAETNGLVLSLLDSFYPSYFVFCFLFFFILLVNGVRRERRCAHAVPVLMITHIWSSVLLSSDFFSLNFFFNHTKCYNQIFIIPMACFGHVFLEIEAFSWPSWSGSRRMIIK